LVRAVLEKPIGTVLLVLCVAVGILVGLRPRTDSRVAPRAESSREVSTVSESPLDATAHVPVIGGAVARIPGQAHRLEPHAVETHAAPDTAWAVERPGPGTRYGSFAAARDHVEKALRRFLGAYADSAHWSRATIRFTYRDSLVLRRPPGGHPYWVVEDRATDALVPSLTMVLDTRSQEGPDVAAIGAELAAQGWVEDVVFSADGPDGSTFGYVCRDALCRIEGRWDGGDDSDSLDTPAPGEHIELTCVPRAPERQR
jgi:hypothetical protein